MDPERKKTLQLIEISIKKLSPRTCGKHLIFLVKDYAEADDLVYARNLIRQIDSDYISDYLYLDAAEDSLLGEALAIIIDTFGLGWTVLKDAGADA